MNKHEPIRLGILGCGIAAHILHWPALARLREDFVITAACNHHRAKAESFAALVRESDPTADIEIFDDWREMFASGRIDAVDILLPVELNPAACAAALSADLHVIAEKPLACDRAGAATMTELTRKHAARIFMIAENFRYRPVDRRIGEIMAAGEIGKVYDIDWRIWKQLDIDDKYAQTAWRINHLYEGGFVTDAGIHNIAALRQLFGDLTHVSSMSGSVNPAIGRCDGLEYTFRAENGAAGHLSLQFSAQVPYLDDLRILAERGTLIVSSDRLQVWKSGTLLREENFVDGAGYIQEFIDFARAVHDGAAPISTVAEAAKDLDTMLTALEKATWYT